MQDREPNKISLAFADSEVPDFKPVYGKDYIPFGKDNKFPDYLIYLLNKSPKHNAIVGSKATYIFGKGMKPVTPDPVADAFINSNYELINKVITDIEAFGMCYVQMIPQRGGLAYGIHHLTYNKCRTNGDNSLFYYKKSWFDNKTMNEAAQCFPAFTPGIQEPSVFMFKEYRPGSGVYGLPGFLPCCNYIEADIEVSMHTLTNAQTGFSASKFINFYNGEPDEALKRSIEERVNAKFGGSEGKKVMVGFNADPAKRPTVDDLGASDLTKENFANTDDMIAANIYAGHKIINQALFGVPSARGLGSNSGAELRVSYDIFNATYVGAKRTQMERIINFFAKLQGVGTEIVLQGLDPVGFTFTEQTLLQVAPRPWLMEKLGIDEKEFESITSKSAVISAIDTLSPLVANKVLDKMTPDEVRALVGLPPTLGGSVIADAATAPPMPVAGAVSENMVNENIKNLTAKQHQQLMRIIRQVTKGQLDRSAAITLLKTGLGLNDADIATLLPADKFNEDEDAFGSDDDVAMLFEAHGEPLNESEKVYMSRVVNMASDYSDVEEKIKELIKAKPKFTPVQIAKELAIPVEVVEEYVKISSGVGGAKIALPKFITKFSYELRSGVSGAEVLPTTRPFCKKMIALKNQGRMYTFQDIQKISNFLGYNVMLRTGGFWNNNGKVEYHCRHQFVSHLVIKK